MCDVFLFIFPLQNYYIYYDDIYYNYYNDSDNSAQCHWIYKLFLCEKILVVIFNTIIYLF